MVKRHIALFCCLIVGVGVVSCTRFKARHYVGEKMFLTEADISTETVWEVGERAYWVRLIEGGTLMAATLEWDEKKNAYKMRTHELVSSKLGDHIFLNVKDGGYYTILRIVGAGDDTLVLLTVDKDKLEKDMAEGNLQARKEDNDIVMDASKEALDRYIESHMDTLFSLDAAAVARLISGELK